MQYKVIKRSNTPSPEQPINPQEERPEIDPQQPIPEQLMQQPEQQQQEEPLVFGEEQIQQPQIQQPEVNNTSSAIPEFLRPYIPQVLQDSYQLKQDATQYVDRIGKQLAARTFESVIGAPREIAEGIQALGNLPFYLNKGEQPLGQKVPFLPSMEGTRNSVTQTLSNVLYGDKDYLEPQTTSEKNAGEFINTVIPMLMVSGENVLTPKGFSNIKRVAKVAGLGQLSKWASDSLDMPSEVGETVKAGTMLATSLLGTRGAREYASDLYTSADENTPKTASAVVKNAYDKGKDLFKKYNERLREFSTEDAQKLFDKYRKKNVKRLSPSEVSKIFKQFKKSDESKAYTVRVQKMFRKFNKKGFTNLPEEGLKELKDLFTGYGKKGQTRYSTEGSLQKVASFVKDVENRIDEGSKKVRVPFLFDQTKRLNRAYRNKEFSKEEYGILRGYMSDLLGEARKDKNMPKKVKESINNYLTANDIWSATSRAETIGEYLKENAPILKSLGIGSLGLVSAFFGNMPGMVALGGFGAAGYQALQRLTKNAGMRHYYKLVAEGVGRDNLNNVAKGIRGLTKEYEKLPGADQTLLSPEKPKEKSRDSVSYKVVKKRR